MHELITHFCCIEAYSPLFQCGFMHFVCTGPYFIFYNNSFSSVFMRRKCGLPHRISPKRDGANNISKMVMGEWLHMLKICWVHKHLTIWVSIFSFKTETGRRRKLEAALKISNHLPFSLILHEDEKNGFIFYSNTSHPTLPWAWIFSSANFSSNWAHVFQVWCFCFITLSTMIFCTIIFT